MLKTRHDDAITHSLMVNHQPRKTLHSKFLGDYYTELFYLLPEKAKKRISTVDNDPIHPDRKTIIFRYFINANFLKSKKFTELNISCLFVNNSQEEQNKN